MVVLISTLLKAFLVLTQIGIDFEAQNLCVWGPHSLKTTIASIVYDSLVSHDPNPWSSWDYMWKLCVLPRIKAFIWKLALGKLPTGAYLYDLNIGPYTQCSFYDLVSETTSYFIWSCCKIVPSWNSLFATFYLDVNLLDEFSFGSWLMSRFSSKS